MRELDKIQSSFLQDWLVEEILKIRVEGLNAHDFSASQSTDMGASSCVCRFIIIILLFIMSILFPFNRLFLGSHFEGVVSQFRELSTRAIHVLRLEVRSHCFYFLDQAFRQVQTRVNIDQRNKLISLSLQL